MRGYEPHDRGIIITLLSELALSFFPADYLGFVNSVAKLFACVITLDNSCYLVISNLCRRILFRNGCLSICRQPIDFAGRVRLSSFIRSE